MIQRFKQGPRHLVDHLNQMVDALNLLSNTTGSGAAHLSQTMHGRANSVSIDQIDSRIPRLRISYYKIFEVQSAATGDGVYNCFEQKLDATEWADTAGDNKFDDKNTTEVEVLNLAEFDPEATYVAHLTAGDLIIAWPIFDDEGNKRWIGLPNRQANADRPRVAYCKTDAPASTTITCYLDTDGTGTEISVSCFIAQGGTALNDALPRLKDGDGIMVSKVGSTWRCLTTFMKSIDCDCYSA